MTNPEPAEHFTAEEQQQMRMDTLIGSLLLTGVLASLALTIVGLIWEFVRSGHVMLNYQISGMNLFQFADTTVRQGLAGRFQPAWWINAGLIVLMLTPFVRVLTSVAYFAVAVRNGKYTVFTLFVLAVLTWSLFLRA